MDPLNIKQNWYHLPTVRQLHAICNCYNLKRSGDATRDQLLVLLDESNIHLKFTSYDGPKEEWKGALIHWYQDPEVSTDSDSSDDCDYSESNETNAAPAQQCDTKVDASLATYECRASSDFNVQFEEEVEAVEH
ncbi:uncharacterized protein LOC119075360 [Bradysia coprophila]|uniref:uncharacterized protein LOC119075360 n=1 Tax=Bradysia coprophila TaxID=38358 RepID=UPI00187D9E62|nr:uncharacterized protein LOC119075360 [Bradysia coprophila]